jgi:hypothetical protein
MWSPKKNDCEKAQNTINLTMTFYYLSKFQNDVRRRAPPDVSVSVAEKTIEFRSSKISESMVTINNDQYD